MMVYARNDGVGIWYEVEGHGPPLVLVHGATVSLEMWRTIGYTEALRADHRLILVDARGHGRSGKPHDPADYRPELMVGDIVAVLDDLGVQRAHYLGASMGAAIGFEMARHARQRLDSLIILGYGRYGPFTAAQQEFQDRGRRLFAMAAEMGAAAALRTIEERAGPRPARERAQFLANDWQALHAFLTAFDTWPAFDDMLPGLTLPCLVMIGESDPLAPSARRCAEVLPRATFVGLAGGTHSQDSYPAATVVPQIRAFLTRTARNDAVAAAPLR